MGRCELLLCMVRWGSVDECKTLDYISWGDIVGTSKCKTLDYNSMGDRVSKRTKVKITVSRIHLCVKNMSDTI